MAPTMSRSHQSISQKRPKSRASARTERKWTPESAPLPDRQRTSRALMIQSYSLFQCQSMFRWAMSSAGLVLCIL